MLRLFLHVVYIVIFFLFCGFSVTAKGQKKLDEEWVRAEKLVEEKRYNEAIPILTDIIRKYPDAFDRVEGLLKKIRQAKEEYNEKYEDLIELFNSDDFNLDAAYALIKELDELDKTPNKATVDAFAEAKVTIVFVYNNKFYKKIMDEARALIVAKKYWEAAELYLTGFDIHRDSFNEAKYGNLVENMADTTLASVRNTANRFIAAKPVARKTIGRIENIFLQKKYTQIRAETLKLITVLDSIKAMRDTVFRLAVKLELQNLQLRRARNNDIPFLSTMNRLFIGRQKGFFEGITGAMDALRQDSFNVIEDNCLREYQANYRSAINFINKKEWAPALSSINNASIFLGHVVYLSRFWDKKAKVGNKNYLKVTSPRLPKIASLDILGEALNSCKRLITAARIVAGVENSMEDKNLSRISALRTNLSKQYQEYKILENKWQVYKKKFTTASSLNFSVPETRIEVDKFLSLLRLSILNIRKIEINLVLREAEMIFALLNSEYLIEEKNSVEAKNVLKGIKSMDGEEEVIHRYPQKGLDKLLAVKNNLVKISEKAKQNLNSLTGEPPHITGEKSVKTIISKEKNLLAKITNLLNSLENPLKKARAELFQAKKFKQEGFTRINEVEQAIKKSEFSRAKSSLKNAEASFYKSFSYQYDPDLEKTIEDKLEKLNNIIVDREHRLVIAEIRKYIDDGKDLYQQAFYSKANDFFQKADSRWRVTKGDEENPEIKYWLNLVRNALSITSGREIAETDPLYQDMRQLLNLSWEDYLKGKKLAEAGSSGNEFFEEAKKKIARVKIPFPHNQEASVLLLRITKYIDPDKFPEFFRQKYNSAVKKLGNNSGEGYLELLDLYKIDPGYPGLKNSIKKAKYRLKIIPKPVSREKKRESMGLYTKALAIFNSMKRNQFPQAQKMLNRAIEIYPENSAAIRLKDKIGGFIGGSTTTVLTGAARRMYLTAQKLFKEKNYFECIRVAKECILKYPKSKGYAPLRKLKERAEKLLGM